MAIYDTCFESLLTNACFRLVSGQTHLSHTEQVTTNFEGLLKGQCPAMVACYISIIKSLGKSATVMWTLINTVFLCRVCFESRRSVHVKWKRFVGKGRKLVVYSFCQRYYFCLFLSKLHHVTNGFLMPQCTLW